MTKIALIANVTINSNSVKPFFLTFDISLYLLLLCFFMIDMSNLLFYSALFIV
ncbi:Uncharacterised protein [Mycobacteroides abscessus subsp. abscessus]|nr:Uncharacterised protein [Mycobacteroides abscessus subsp. abscessus]